MKRKLLSFGTVALAAVAIGATGCGEDNDTEPSSASSGADTESQTETRSTGAPTETGASELRSTLTAGLQEHVYLAGIAISTGVGSGLDSPEFEAAAGTLDQNSVALSEAIGSVYGDDAGKQFLALWRDHIGFFVDYTKAKAGGDQQQIKAARKKLDDYRAEFGAFLSSANPELTQEAVAEELKPHVNSVFDTIDAVVANDPKTYDLLQTAAGHMPGTANVLAGAIAAQMPDQFDGSTDSGASELRATLTAGLQEHVYLAGIAISTGVGSGLDSPEFEAAAGTLDQNSVALSEAIGSVYGDDAGKQFLALWRDHIGFFVDYTKAKAGGDQQQIKAARKKLDDYRAEFGAFLSSANPELTQEAVAEELKPHVNSVFDTIDAVVANDPKTYDLLQTAAGHMPGTANVLAGAIAAQFPDKFGSS